MKYGDVVLNPRQGSLIIKDVKSAEVIIYPRVNQADSQLMQLEPSVVMCTLVIRDWDDYFALKQMDRTNGEYKLYVDASGLDSHYYKRVILELGEATRVRDVSFVPAHFTALDPYLYSAATNEVVY